MCPPRRHHEELLREVHEDLGLGARDARVRLLELPQQLGVVRHAVLILTLRAIQQTAQLHEMAKMRDTRAIGPNGTLW